MIQKDSTKGTVPNNYGPITCLPMMRKILTAQIREKIYNSLTSLGLFLEEQKGCRKGSRGTAGLLYIDQHILNESKTRRKNLAMAWIDCKKVYNMVLQSWIINKMYKISHEVTNFIEETMKTWRVELTAGGRSLAETKIQRGIFLGDAVSSLLFIIAMMPLNHILRKYTAGYKLSSSQEKINHLMYMDDIKLFAKNEKELETLIYPVRIYSQGIGMKFGREKCAMLVMKSGKLIEWKYQIKTGLDRSQKTKPSNTWVSWRLTPSNKWKWKKEYLRKARKLLETKLSCWNLIKGINTRAVSRVRYSRPFLKWTRDELK